MNRALIIITAAIMLIAVACNGDDDDAPATETPTSTATAAPTATATAPPTETPAATPTATTTPAVSLRELLESLDPDPQASEPDTDRDLGDPPASPYPAHDGESTVLYDIEAGEVIDLGVGEGGYFSPDGRYLVWVSHAGAQNELRALDLDTREQRTLMEAGVLVGAGFARDGRFIVRGLGGSVELVDPETGESESADDAAQPFLIRASEGTLMLTPDPGAQATWQLIDTATDEVLVTFAAHGAQFAGPRELLVVTPLVEDGGSSTGNLYVVDIDAATATFVATVDFGSVAVAPVGGSAGIIAWTDNYCGPAGAGMTLYYDRSADELIALDASRWVTVTPDGRLGFGEFGPHMLVDPDTLDYDVVLPEGPVDVNWSADFRYASRGMVLGHGGHCPP